MRVVTHVLGRVAFYVAAAVFAAVFALPLLWLVFAPFGSKATLSVALPDPFTLSNFGKVFANTFAVRALFQNSIIQAVGTMILVTLLATLAAYALSRAPIRGRDVLSYGLVLFSSIVTGTAATQHRMSISDTSGTPIALRMSEITAAPNRSYECRCACTAA